MGQLFVGQPEPHGYAPARRHREGIVQGNLGSGWIGIDGVFLPPNHVGVDAILGVRCSVGRSVQAFVVGFVFGKKHFRFAIDVAVILAQFLAVQQQQVLIHDRRPRPLFFVLPAGGTPKP